MADLDENFLAISGIMHFKFCRRRWSLIHIEREWAENYHTVKGELMHERVHDEARTEKRGSTILSRGMPIKSEKYKINGVCDMVEFIRDDAGVSIFGREGRYRIHPVEYKKGRHNEASTWQLCAQVLCLEEMFVTEISTAAVYYGETRRREVVEITPDLRSEVIAAIGEMHQLYKRAYTPKVKPQKACKNCSMKDICLPTIQFNKSAKKYVEEVFAHDEKTT